METVGQILHGGSEGDALKKAAWNEAVAWSKSEFERERTWKVMLSKMAFFEIEVFGTIHTVDRAAEQNAGAARLLMDTAPFAFRFYVQKRADPRNPESPLVWVEVVHAPVDPLDSASPLAWQLKR